MASTRVASLPKAPREASPFRNPVCRAGPCKVGNTKLTPVLGRIVEFRPLHSSACPRLEESRARPSQCRQPCSCAEAQVAKLRQQLEDAHVAIVGYKIDLEREKKLSQQLEADLAELAQKEANGSEACTQASQVAAEIRRLAEIASHQPTSASAKPHSDRERQKMSSPSMVEACTRQVEEIPRLFEALSDLEAGCKGNFNTPAHQSEEQLPLTSPFAAVDKLLPEKCNAAQLQLCWLLANLERVRKTMERAAHCLEHFSKLSDEQGFQQRLFRSRAELPSAGPEHGTELQEQHFECSRPSCNGGPWQGTETSMCQVLNSHLLPACAAPGECNSELLHNSTELIEVGRCWQPEESVTDWPGLACTGPSSHGDVQSSSQQARERGCGPQGHVDQDGLHDEIRRTRSVCHALLAKQRQQDELLEELLSMRSELDSLRDSSLRESSSLFADGAGGMETEALRGWLGPCAGSQAEAAHFGSDFGAGPEHQQQLGDPATEDAETSMIVYPARPAWAESTTAAWLGLAQAGTAAAAALTAAGEGSSSGSIIEEEAVSAPRSVPAHHPRRVHFLLEAEAEAPAPSQPLQGCGYAWDESAPSNLSPLQADTDASSVLDTSTSSLGGGERSGLLAERALPLEAFLKSWIMETIRGMPSSVGLNSLVGRADVVDLFQQICCNGRLPPHVLPEDLTPRTWSSKQAVAVEKAVNEVWNTLYPDQSMCSPQIKSSTAAMEHVVLKAMESIGIPCTPRPVPKLGTARPPRCESVHAGGSCIEPEIDCQQEELRELCFSVGQEIGTACESAGETGGTPQSATKVTPQRAAKVTTAINLRAMSRVGGS